ncbi:hypothetical protein MRX96_056899 [Rhipicephalus microplus]
MANESCIDVSIPLVPQPRSTLLLTTVPDLYASLSRIAVTDPRTRSPTTSTLESCESSRNTGNNPNNDDSTSIVIACPPELLAHVPAVLMAPDFTATSNNAPPTALHCSRGQEPLLTQEAGATLAHEPEIMKASTLKYFLVAILFAGLVITAVLATTNALEGALAAYDLLPEEEQQPILHRSRSSDDAPQGCPGPGTVSCGPPASPNNYSLSSWSLLTGTRPALSSKTVLG